jgi:hypothetical protein
MYYIYHISKVKIGCTTNPKKRVKEQGFSNFEILESHSDIYIASDREIELQKQYGYPVDKIPYHISKNNRRVWKKSDSDKGRETMLKNGFFNEWYKKGNLIMQEKYSKKTIMCDSNGNHIMIFKSRTDAANYVNGNPGGVSMVLNHPTQTYKGYKWVNG